jgi:thioredoxin reductase
LNRVAITLDGEPIEARAGETVAATLVAHGITVFRTTRRNAERGLFCGMGVCQDCLVEIDGRPSQRACMTVVAHGMTVRCGAHAGPGIWPASAPPATIDEVDVVRPELLIIGGGPGGLAAAIAARSAGVEVVLVDERSAPGGQYFKPLAVGGADVAPADRQHREGAALVERAQRGGVRIRSGVTVWGAFHPGEFAASGADGTVRYIPKSTIVATGAYERPWPVPGWTLPGVMTTGAAQTLWRTARRLPGRRVLIAGHGPLNLQLAAELIAGGCEISAVVEAGPAPGMDGIGPMFAMTASAPRLVADGLRYHAMRWGAGAAMIHGMVVGSIDRTEGGLAVELVSANGNERRRRIETDIVCLGYGFEPSNEVLRALRCQHDFDAGRDQLVTRRDAGGRTSVAGIYAIGDCTGLGGARLAMADGVLAGLAAAAELGYALGPALRSERQRAMRVGARHRRFQKALWSLYGAAGGLPVVTTDATILCRCEEVTLGEVKAAVRQEPCDAGAVKRRTRAGMGACQGRYCRRLLERAICEAHGGAPTEFSGFAPRVPLKPIAICDLVPPGRS